MAEDDFQARALIDQNFERQRRTSNACTPRRPRPREGMAAGKPVLRGEQGKGHHRAQIAVSGGREAQAIQELQDRQRRLTSPRNDGTLTASNVVNAGTP
jgi:hypothetical protein